MQGLALDRRLAPDYPGITDANSLSDWDPPFPIDLGLVRPADEDYWRRFRATPKAFISARDGQRLWRTRHGQAHVAAPAIDRRPAPISTASARASARRDPARRRSVAARGSRRHRRSGAEHRRRPPARRTSPCTSRPSASFSWSPRCCSSRLFFRLSIEQRLRQIGVLRAAGYSLRAVRRLFLREGLLVAAVGGSLGIVLAIGWAALMMYGLRHVVGGCGRHDRTFSCTSRPARSRTGWLGGLAAGAAVDCDHDSRPQPHVAEALLTGAADVSRLRRVARRRRIAAGSLAAAAALTSSRSPPSCRRPPASSAPARSCSSAASPDFAGWLGRRRASDDGHRRARPSQRVMASRPQHGGGRSRRRGRVPHRVGGCVSQGRRRDRRRVGHRRFRAHRRIGGADRARSVDPRRPRGARLVARAGRRGSAAASISSPRGCDLATTRAV